jgi:hypothetical protein
MKFGIHSLLFIETFTERDLSLVDKAKAMDFDAVAAASMGQISRLVYWLKYTPLHQRLS